jgi:hypothetical protein
MRQLHFAPGALSQMIGGGGHLLRGEIKRLVAADMSCWVGRSSSSPCIHACPIPERHDCALTESDRHTYRVANMRF